MGDKLFTSWRAVFELAQGLQDSKTSDWICLYEVLMQKETLIIRFVQLYCSGNTGMKNSKKKMINQFYNILIACNNILFLILTRIFLFLLF